MNGRRQNCYDAYEFNDDSDNDDRSPSTPSRTQPPPQQQQQTTVVNSVNPPTPITPTAPSSTVTSNSNNSPVIMNATPEPVSHIAGGAIAITTSVSATTASTATVVAASASDDNHVIISIPQVKTEPVEMTTSLKEGFSSCDRCGSLGIRDAFYSKEKRFCSVACWRSFNVANKPGKRFTKKRKKSSSEHGCGESQNPEEGGTVTVPIPPMTATIPLEHITSIPGSEVLAQTPFKWSSYLNETLAQGAPLTCFKHIPLKCYWKSLTTGVKVEVKNTDVPPGGSQVDVYWIASVVKIAGYLTLLRFEGFGERTSDDFWVNICSSDVHHVGWCASKHQHLLPPKSIQNDVTDWEAYLIKTLIGAKTIPQDFHRKVTQSLQYSQFNINDTLELLDKKRIASMRVGRVEDRVGGRLCIQYLNSDGDDFWCHQLSPLIHPVGWSMIVGHNLIASQEYRQISLRKGQQKMVSDGEVAWSVFHPYQAITVDGDKQTEWAVGMKLEAIDPLNLSTVSVATVKKVLSHKFLMIGIDGAETGYGCDWFCYHGDSPCIFPAGFCQLNKIALAPPKGYGVEFSWMEYLESNKSSVAPVHLFNMEIPNHGFKPGMKLEAVDLMEPKMVCVATVARVVGRLLRVHFDGWDAIYDQWIDCDCPDLFPIGWCQLMDYTLEPPGRRLTETAVNAADAKSQKRKRSTGFSKPRKRKKLMRKSSVPEVNMTLEFCNMTPSSSSPEPSPLSPTTDPPTPDPVPSWVNKPRAALSVEELFKSHEQSKIQNNNNNNNNTGTNTGSNSSSSSGPGVTTNISNNGPRVPTNSNNNSSAATNTSNTSVSTDTISQQLITNVTGVSVEQQTLSSLLNSRKPTVTDYRTVEVKRWSTDDVLHFLTDIGCEPQVEIFRRNLIDGQRLDGMSKERISSLTGMRVGPSLKIYDYIQAMKSKH